MKVIEQTMSQFGLNRCKFVGLAVSIMLVFSCNSSASTELSVPLTQINSSKSGVVATADPLATQAGVRMLELGGNAVDAAVAAAFALSVVDPSMSGIGGRAVLLLRTADGRFHGIDGATQVPKSYGPNDKEVPEFGYGTIGVPGALAAYSKALKEFGTLPLHLVLQPAIEFAEKGIILPFSRVDEGLIEFPGSRENFLRPDGSPFLVGQHFVQKELASTLRHIAEQGVEVFYKGEIAEAIVRDMQENGGFVSSSDLANYQAKTLRIVNGNYRGFKLVGTGSPPSGYMLIEALHIMEHFDLQTIDTAGWSILLCRALKMARHDRDTLPGTPEFRETQMVSKALAADRARELSLIKPIEHISPATDDGEPTHTSHLSVVDGDGMIVVMSQSLGPAFGSRVVTPGLGFLYAKTINRNKAYIPGSRPRLSQSPFMVLKNGEPYLALGAAGGQRIPSAILNVVSRLIDRGDDIADAIRNPRVHAGNSCPSLENTGSLIFTGRINGDKITGEFRSEFGDIYPITSNSQSEGDRPLGEWMLEAKGNTSHPYSDFGPQLLLHIAKRNGRLIATLSNSSESPIIQPELQSRQASLVEFTSGKLTINFPARISWTADEKMAVSHYGVNPQLDQSIARVHAVYYDKFKDTWVGVADIRGRGSVGSPAEVSIISKTINN
jgi:gamma-glutamyltranspeptidase/glutathione hydrolase